MSVKTYINRAIRYIIKGQPVQIVIPNIMQIPENNWLLNKVVLITGGTSGIGKAIAVACARAGADVYITGRNQQRLETAIGKINSFNFPKKTKGVILDNADVKNIQIVLKDFLSHHSVDILINNAGVNGALLQSCSEKEYDDVMNTNLKGSIFISRIIGQDMIAKNIKGNILNICSSSSVRPANSAYVLSKWGMRSFTLGLAKSLIKHGIVVNGLAPGPTATPMLVNEENSNIALPDNPSGRYVLPEEVANMAVVLVSGFCRMVVGDIVYITGGAGLLTIDDIKY